MQVQVWIGTSRIAGKGRFAGQAITKDPVICRYRGTTIAKAQSVRALVHGNASMGYRHDRYDLDGTT